MAKIRPVGDKIVVKRVAANDRTSGGIIIPEMAREKTNRGKVVAVGDGTPAGGYAAKVSGEKVPLCVKPGDEIIFGSYSGSEIKLDNEDLLIISQDDVLVVIE